MIDSGSLKIRVHFGEMFMPRKSNIFFLPLKVGSLFFNGTVIIGFVSIVEGHSFTKNHIGT